MEDILQDSPDGAQFELSELVDATPKSTPVPKGAVRNRAATTALLSGEPDKLIEKYQLLMAEGMEGNNVTHDEVMAQINAGHHAKNMGMVIQLLGDKDIPLEQKKKIMKVVQEGGMKVDPTDSLRMASLQSPSKGEDLKGESARISLADTMGEINQEAQDRQRMVNSLLATLPSADLGTVGDLAATEVLPFGRNIIASKVGSKLNELEGKPFSLGQVIKDFLLPGSAKADVKTRLASIPPAKREEFTRNILGAIKEGASVFPSENHYAQFVNAVEFLDLTLPSNTEVWTENLLTVLDTFWIGSEMKALKNATKGAKPAVFDTSKARRPGSAKEGVSDAENVVEKAEWELVPEPFNPFAPQIGTPKARIEYKRADAAKRIELASPVKRENPVTPFSVIEQVNPEQARAFHQAIVESTSDEIAEALTGVGRVQAIANNIYPQVGSESGNVLNKVDQTIVEQVQNTGATRYTTEEFEGAVQGVKRDFRNASGLQINDAMTTFRVDGDHMIIEGHYATSGGSFVTPEAAKAQAKFALRGYGIRDDEITILKREGMEYVPVGPGDTQSGDYIVKVATKHAIDDSEIAKWNPLDVKRNWTDRISTTVSQDSGSMSGWAMDPGSMLHPTITGSAAVASDQAVVLETMLLKPIQDFRLKVKGFEDTRRLAIEDYLKEANFKGIKFDRLDLMGRGFSKPEIDAIKQWRDIWDNHYYLENYDMVRTLNAQGYQVFDNGGTKLFGKPVPKNQNIGAVYDPASDSVRSLPVDEMDSLYNQGGSYVKFRRPVEMNGRQVEYMMVRNTPTEYMRKIRDNDQILNYREGYYTVNYAKGSKFVDELTVDSAGNEVRRTVAVAGNTHDAQMFADAQAASTGNRYKVREDSRGLERDGDGYWDVSAAAGRIAQRLRGKTLESADGLNMLGDVGTYVDSPLDSASRAARSISGRTVNRPVIETAKQRFMAQYADMLPSDGMGGKRWPNHYSEIVDHGNSRSGRVADARTTYGYINYLEDGLINGIDNAIKGAFNTVAEMLNGSPTLERAFLKAGQVSPTQAAKRLVFNAYIVGSNPIRQWIVQPHQMTRMIAYNPFGVPGMMHKMVGYIGEYSGFPQADKAMQDFIKFVDDSGMVAGVDRNTLVRGLKMELTENSWTATKVASGGRDALQYLGFDIGEKMNMLGHLAAVHEKWTKKGINLADKTQRDLALAEARALSYDLNRAGELHYTQSSAAAILQFLQMPHKGWLQLTNRKISPAVRARMFAWDTLMYGLGGGMAYTAANKAYETFFDQEGMLPDDPETRDKVLYGLESTAINWMLSQIDDSGEKTRVDFSALASNDMEGWARMWHALMDDGGFAAFSASPVGQLFSIDGVNGSKRNGRIPQALITMGRYINVFEELDPENPTEFTSVLNDAAKISSLWSAASNAMIMYEARKKLDAMGGVVDSQVTMPEIWMAGLGFGTLATKELYMVSRNRAQDKKRHEEELMVRYRDIINYYKNADLSTPDKVLYSQKVVSMLMRSFQGQDLEFVTNQWKKDMVGREMGLTKQLIQAAGIPDSQKLIDDIKMAPHIDDATKEKLIQMHRDIKAAGKQIKEND